MSVSIRSNQTGISYTSRQQQQIASLSDKSNLVSALTSSLPSGRSSGGAMASLTMNVLNGGGDSSLSDYASIKNGSYGKLMKAYYSEVGKKVTKEDVTEDGKIKDTKEAEKDTSKDSTKAVYSKEGTKTLTEFVDGSFQTFS